MIGTRVLRIPFELGSDPPAARVLRLVFSAKNRFRDSHQGQKTDLLPPSRAQCPGKQFEAWSPSRSPAPVTWQEVSGLYRRRRRAGAQLLDRDRHSDRARSSPVPNVALNSMSSSARAAPGRSARISFRITALASWQVGQQKSYVNEIVRGVIVHSKTLPCRNSILPNPSFTAARSRASSTFTESISMPTTWPFAPARRAISNVTSPAPQPRSRPFQAPRESPRAEAKSESWPAGAGHDLHSLLPPGTPP